MTQIILVIREHSPQVYQHQPYLGTGEIDIDTGSPAYDMDIATDRLALGTNNTYLVAESQPQSKMTPPNLSVKLPTVDTELAADPPAMGGFLATSRPDATMGSAHQVPTTTSLI